MILLRRLLLDSIGESNARFSNTLFDFSDPSDGRTVDTIVWLRNGGGKTSLLSLFFSLLLPRQHDFIGAKLGRCLADYVLTNDVAHVVAEWDTPVGPLVTGAVYQWPGRQRPSDHKTRQGELLKRWYVFTPSRDILTLDTLPLREGGKRVGLEGYLKSLRTISREAPSLQLSVATSMSDWHTALDARGVNPSLFRYQKDMNRGEGTIDEIFQFSTAASFVEFMTEMVVDPDSPDSLAQNLTRVAEKLGRRELRETEQLYCDGLAERLEVLGTSWNERSSAFESFGVLRDDAQSLGQALGAARQEAQQAVDRAVAEREAIASELSSTRTARQIALDLTKEYRLRLCAFEVASAESELERLRDERTSVDAEIAAREALDQLIALDTAARAIAQIDELLSERAREAEPLREARNIAARRLRGRLAQLADRHDEDMTIADGEIRSMNDMVTRARRQIVVHHKGEALSRSEHERLSAELSRFAEDLAVAVREGLLAEGETAAAASERTGDYLSELERKRDRIEDEQQDRDRRLIEIEQELLTCMQVAAQLGAKSDELLRVLEDVRGRRDLLVASERLRDLAETSTLALWTASGLLDQRLGEEIERVGHEIVDIGVLNRADERKASALADGLLPPSEDVESLLTTLSRAGVRATAGFAYVSASVPRRRWDEVIAAHPAILSGVVVDAADIDRAREVCIEAKLHPGSLVVVATKSALDRSDATENFVVPASPALLDSTAAVAERAVVLERLERASATVRELESARRADENLREHLRRFLEDVPAGYIDAREAELAKATEELGATETSVERLTVEQERLRADVERARQDLREISSDRERAIDVLNGLQRLAQREAEREASEQARTAAERAIKDHAQKVVELQDEIDAAERRIESAKTRRDQHRHAAEATRSELAAIDFVGDSPPDDSDNADDVGDEVTTIDTDALRSDFALRHRHWSQEVGDAVLEERRSHHHETMRTTQVSLSRFGEAARRDAETLRIVGAMADPVRRAETLMSVRQAKERLIASVAGVEGDLERARRALRQHQPPSGDAYRTLREEEIPVDEEDATARLVVAESTLEELRNRENEQSNAVDACKDRAEAQTTRVNTLRLLVDGMTQVLGHLDPAGAQPFEGSMEEAEELQRACMAGVGRAQQRFDQADRHVHERHHELRKFASESRFRDVDDHTQAADSAIEQLGDQASRLAGEYRNRIAVIAHELESIARDQEILVTGFNGQVRRVIELLMRATRLSIMPDGLGEWSGKSFLGINFEDPRSDDIELRRRVSEEIDAVVQSGSVPDGITLLKRVLRAVVPKGFRVHILKPNADLLAERVPITNMSAWSGGEKLTAAVVLYCTLARLRAGARSGVDVSGGILLLDNPLGKSSYVRFVALQRRVAAVLGVQLAYTTAVKDLAAVGTFPNVIRCRNVRPPGRRHRYVDAAERVGDSHGLDLDAVRPVRVVRGEGSGGGADLVLFDTPVVSALTTE